MSKAPAFQFHPGDWDRDTKVLSLAEKGVYFGLLCLLRPKGSFHRNMGYPIAAWARLLGGAEEEVWPLLFSLTARNLCTIHFGHNSDRFCIVLNSPYAARFPLPSNWHALRKEILQRDNFLCRYCGNLANSVDHIKPRSRGGYHTKDNLVAACRACNSRKKNHTLEEWARRVL